VIMLAWQKMSVASVLEEALDHQEVVSESWILELGPDDSIEEVTEILERFGASWERAFPSVDLNEDMDLAQVFLVHVSTAEAGPLTDALRADAENVDHVEINFDVHLDTPSSSLNLRSIDSSILEDDPLASKQWALEAINGHAVHGMVADLEPAKKALVAILDTGVDANHEDVSQIFTSSPATTDLHGHGSHCAGIAGAATNNGLGIASLNWEGRFLDIVGYQALNDQGFGSIEMISQAIIDATEDGVDVISMSLGAKAETPKVIRDAIEFAMERNVIVVASAGNANEDAIDHMPSNVDGVIVVSAVDRNLDKARFSNTNMSLSRPITAPGVDILSLKTGGGYVTMSGTSMSTPVVSGIIGMMRAFAPDISDEDVWQILDQTSRPVRDSQQIGNLVDAEAALQRVMDLN
jgi:thermitase